ncbi:MAG: right-handed parallel beta-helix repeat-containing protein [Thermoplasmatales archaeon]|nr:MAG: right-handed parallel beta-helix repeat-containing protein [Thermoplasmatales archaeon]
MKKNSLFRNGVVITIIALFVGVSVLPATGSILQEESLKPTEKSSEFEKSQSTSRNMDYDKYQLYHNDHDTNSRCITKERVSQIPRDPIEYEELGSSHKYSVDMDMSYKGNYTPHDPIRIDGDGDFTPENGVVGGNGTINDPYIIEGWEIVAQPPSGTAIKVVQTSAYFIIQNCYLESGSAPQQGLRFYELQNGRADHVVISSDYEGIEIWDSSDVILSNLTISDSYKCIDIDYHSHHVSIVDSTLTSSNTGIHSFNDVKYVEVSNITTQGVNVGIHLSECLYTTITDCNLYGNSRGIEIIVSGYTTMRNNTMHDNKQGLYIGGLFGYKDYVHDIDTSNTINGDPIYYYRNQSNIVIDGSDGIGFLGFLECDNITVKNYHTKNTGNSIIMAGTHDSQILQSSFTDNTVGLDIAYCENILISDCVVDNINFGIMLLNSQYCILRNNSYVNITEFPFEVYGNQHQMDNFIHDIDTSNTINGQPILYLVGEKNIRITKNTEFAYLALVNCEKVRVVNVNFNQYISQGILIVNTTGIIRGCTASYNFYGIQIVNCSDLWVLNCVARGCYHGFELWDSTGVKIIGCRATAGDDGFYMDTCSETLIMRCNIYKNGYQGINLYDSWDNTFFNNRFTDTNYGGIYFKEGCYENEVCFNTITNCNFGIGIGFYDWGQNIHHNTLKRNDFTGIDLYESINNSITYNIVEDNGNYGILVAFDTGSQIDHNNIAGNEVGMVVVECTADVSNNWWGSADGPSGIGPGTGDILRLTDATVYYEPWLEREVRVKLHGILYILGSIFGLT